MKGLVVGLWVSHIKLICMIGKINIVVAIDYLWIMTMRYGLRIFIHMYLRRPLCDGSASKSGDFDWSKYAWSPATPSAIGGWVIHTWLVVEDFLHYFLNKWALGVFLLPWYIAISYPWPPLEGLLTALTRDIKMISRPLWSSAGKMPSTPGDISGLKIPSIRSRDAFQRTCIEFSKMDPLYKPGTSRLYAFQ